MTKHKRKAYQPKADGKLETSKSMAHMREVAFGDNTYYRTKDVLERAARMRDDDGLQARAEEKRQRKITRNRNGGS